MGQPGELNKQKFMVKIQLNLRGSCLKEEREEREGRRSGLVLGRNYLLKTSKKNILNVCGEVN